MWRTSQRYSGVRGVGVGRCRLEPESVRCCKYIPPHLVLEVYMQASYITSLRAQQLSAHGMAVCLEEKAGVRPGAARRNVLLRNVTNIKSTAQECVVVVFFPLFFFLEREQI